MKLTGLVIAQDEARDLPRCLEALAFCDERLVIDGGSTDGTPDLARAAGARVEVNPWPGYAPQRRFGLAAARGDWVLAVDADEVADARLRTAVERVLMGPREAGYAVRVRNWVCGRPLRFGGAGADWHLRLVRRADAQVTDRAVHEGLRIAGRAGRLDGVLEHHSYASLREFVEKMERYATLGAEEQFRAGRRMSRVQAALRLPFSFGWRYVGRLGFLDGYPGFVHASLRAYGDFLKGARLVELGVNRADNWLEDTPVGGGQSGGGRLKASN